MDWASADAARPATRMTAQYDIRGELPPNGQELFDTLSKSTKQWYALGGHHIFENIDDMGTAAGYILGSP